MHTMTTNWVLAQNHEGGYERDERSAFVHACARGEPPTGIPPQVAAILVRHAPIAAVLPALVVEVTAGGQASGSTSGCVNRTGLPSDRA